MEESLTCFRAREVLKWRTGAEGESGFCSVVVGRFDCSTAVLKARELVISSAERREMSCGFVSGVVFEWVWFDVVGMSCAYVLLVAAEVQLPLLALVAKTGDVVGEVEARAFFGEDSRGECSRAGHV